MSINRIPDWRSPHYDMSPREQSPVEIWSVIHVREHAEESIARILDFEDLTQFATKEYVDDSIGTTLEYNFNNTTANINEETETTYDMVDIVYAGEETVTRTTITAAPNQLLYCFATLSGMPGGLDLSHGTYDAHLHLEITGGGARSVDIYWTLSSINDDGTNESLIMTSETEAKVSGGETAYTIHAVLGADVTIGSASRLLFKLYGSGNPGSNATMLFHVEGDTGTHVTIKVPSTIFNTIYVRQDGTTPYEGIYVASTGEGGATKFLREDGDGTCSWQEVGGVSSRTSETKTANYLLVSGDVGKTIEMDNAAERTFTLTTAGTLGRGWWCRLVKEGAGKVIIATPGAETIADSSGGGTLYNDISGQAGWANVILEVDYDQGGFSISGGDGIWVTT